MTIAFFLSLLFLPLSARAHDGVVALAYPLRDIAIDGDLSDWPEEATRYPLQYCEDGDPLAGEDDLQAHFRVGYDPGNGFLYVAVEVEDDAIVSQFIEGMPWNGQDGCEIYVKTPHDGAKRPPVQYAFWGDQRRQAINGDAGPLEDGQVARSCAGRHCSFEWRIDLETGSLQVGTVLGFDVAFWDRDRDGSASWVSWGPLAGKYLYPDRLGDLLLVDASTPTAPLRGQVAWEAPEEGSTLGKVRIVSTSKPDLWVDLRTDSTGHYAALLPSGSYELRAGYRRQQSETIAVRLSESTATTVPAIPFARPPVVGREIEAGQGTQTRAGNGVYQGVWQTFDMADGLAGPVISALAQSAEGHLWIGLDGSGLSRFDGVNFTTYTRLDGLAGDNVRALLETSDGLLWIATASGICRYDGQTFRTFTTEDGLAGNFAQALLEDRNGELWIGASGGVSRFDGERFETFTTRDGLPNDQISSIAEDDAGHLWFATRNGACRYDGQTFRTFTVDDGLPDDQIASILPDSRGDLWFTTRNGGLSRYDGRTFHTFDTEDGLPQDPILKGTEDLNGDLWFVTFGGGVVRYDGRKFTTFTVDDGLAHNEVFTLLSDREGNLWFGTLSGLSRYAGAQLTTLTVADGLPDEYVRGVLEDHRGDIWFSIWRTGLCRYDGQTFQTFSDEDGLASNQVLCMLEDRSGDLWFGSYGGLSRYDGQSFTRFTADDGLGSVIVQAIAEDRDGRLWFATINGAFRYDGDSFTHFTVDDGLADPNIQAIAESRDGRLWFATPGGLSRYDGQSFVSFTTDDGLPSDTLICIRADREGDLWLGTMNHGVVRYDGDSFTTFTTEDGLAHNAVVSIAEDREGHLWFGTAGGVTQFDHQVMQSLRRRDGLVDNVAFDLLQDRSGDIWIATLGGVTRYRIRPGNPRIELEDVVADRHYGPIGQIELSAAHPLVRFEFSGRSFKTRPEQIAYLYRLRGYDEKWKTTRENGVEYADLPVGQYTFEVEAVDRDLHYSPEPVSVELAIRPAYAQIAAYGGLGIAIVGLLVVSAYGLKRRNERDNAREELVHEQQRRLEVQQQLVRELEDANARLAEANRQIQQANQHKSEFLARMSHDLRTPMNAIVGYTRIIKRRGHHLLDERQQRNLENILVSADHLLSLINDILDISRVEAGRVELKLEEVDLMKLAGECATSIEMLTGPRVHLDLRLDEVPPVRTDRDRIRRVLMNLLGNAAKFTEEGSITLSLRAEEGCYELRVADTGVGIPSEELPHIFEEFHQVERQGSRKPEGSGLGLAIARRSVELLGGTISVDSEVARGTTFTVEIGDCPAKA